MLQNRAYLGERIHKGQYMKAAWAPIKGLVTPEGRAMFNRVTAKLTDPARRMQRGSEVAHLLTYLGLCGECGDHARLSHAVPRGRRQKSGLRCEVKGDTDIVEMRMNAFVEEAVISWFTDKKKARAALVPADDKIAEMTSAAQKLINAYEEQLNEARRLAEEFDEESGQFKLSAASLASMETRLGPKLETARKKLQSFTGVSPLLLRLLDAKDPDVIWNGRPEAGEASAVEGLALEQKREVIRKIVTVRLYKAQASGRRQLDDGRIRLSFVGEPGFRDRPLRAPATGPVPAPRGSQAAAPGAGSE